ncbi:hypothetical protein [Hymenobacter sp. UYCo722]|uniref:hypothetical protein n=1 Tax=Hymenobacter sp. UYCo722 TaxID=3156335 RepID=UPI003395DD0E
MIYRLILLVIFISLISVAGASAQKPREVYHLTAAQDTLVHQIANDGTVKGRYVTKLGYTPRQYIRFDSLKKISSADDMLVLANHYSAAVKVYAFESLLDNQNWEKALQMLQLCSKDETAFFHLFGCIGGIHTVGYFMGINLKLRLKKNNVILPIKLQGQFETILARLPSYEREERITKRQIKKVMAQADKVDSILD